MHLSLVKGVSAFLRRSSPGHSRGDGSDGAGEGPNAPSWPDIHFRNEGDEAFLGSLWQDYQEALGLDETQKTLENFLENFVRTFANWTPAENLHRGEASNQASEREGSIYGDCSKTAVGCTHGHPTKVISGLVRELKAVIQMFAALNTAPDGSSDAWLSEFDMSMSLLLTEALIIVTRASHNQKIFSHFGGLQSLMGVMKAAVVQLKGVASLVVSDGNTPDSVISQLSFLQTLLSKIVSIVANYIDLEDNHGKSSTAAELRAREPSDAVGRRLRSMHRRSSTDTGLDIPVSRQLSKGLEITGFKSNREATGASSGTVPLMETGGLNWFVELLKLLRILRLKGIPSDSSLEQLVMHSLQQTLMENTRSQNFFRVIGGLQVLLDGLGSLSPNEDSVTGVRNMLRRERNVGESAATRENPVINKMSVEFDLQLLSLRVLREAIFRNSASLQSMRENGGVQKFAQLISWAAFTIPDVTFNKNSLAAQVNTLNSVRMNLSPQSREHISFPAQPIDLPNIQKNSQVTTSVDTESVQSGAVQSSEDVNEFIYEGINLRSWNWRVADLCRILCSILVPVGDAMSFAAGMQGGPEVAGNSSVYWEQATRFIIDVLIDVFQAHDGGLNEVLSDTYSGHSTTLQHYVLHVFKKMLEGTPTVVNLFRKDGVWELVFSEWFFYYGFGVSNGFPGRGKRSSSKSGFASKSKWKVQKAPSLDSGNPNSKEYALSIYVTSDTEPLRLEVISFLELAATTSGILDNLLECGALMEALQHCFFLPRIVTMLAKSLHRVLQLAPEPTIKSLRTLDATSVITHVMEQQIMASLGALKEGSAGSAEKSGLEESSNVDLWPEAMDALSTVFSSYLAASEDAVVDASRNSKAIDALFNLLWDTTTRAFSFSHILLLMKLPPTCEQDQDAKLDLCLKYLQSLPRAQVESRSTDISIVFDLLRGMREVLETELTYYQALFRDGECFVHIVTLLNEERPAEVGSQLSLDVLLTLTRLLQGNEASKGSFRSIVGAGYKTLEFVLLDLHKGKPSRDLLHSLLDMLVDGIFQPSNMVVQNEDVVLLFFNILQRCNEHDQVYGLDTFQLLLEESTANRSACVRAGLLSLLLEWFAKETDFALIVKFGHLMKMIGGHSISGKDMRSIFALLRSSKDGLRPLHGTLLLQIFQGMLKEQGPAVFFDLSGRDSGIVVTSPLRWPSTRGFSFCAWARVEGFPVGSSPKALEGMMGLFSFLSESGKGCTATISSDQLVVESINTKRQLISLKIQLQTKRWYHICITHNTQRALNGGNTIKVYIDGVLASSERLRFPKVGEVLTRCTIGASVSITTVDGIGFSKISGRYAHAFCGQLGPIYLFDDAVSAEQAKGVFSLGPDYMYSFLPSEVGYVPENCTTDSIINDKDGLAFKMVFGYNAQASSGRSLFDISPVLEYSPDPVLYDATIMAGTLLCYRHLVQDSVQCVGGIGVFFPLLTQLDQPVCTISSNVVNKCDQKRVEGYPLDSHVAVEVIDLLTAVLAGNLANQQNMRNMSGMSILGFLLQSVSPQHLTVKVVAALERLVTTVAKGSGASLASALVKEALVKLYFNPHIWIFTPLVVHRELYVSLIKYFKNDGRLLRSVCGLPRVLDMLRHFYWDKPKRRALGSKPLLHPVTKVVIGERPNRSGISELRQLVLVLAEGVLREKVTLIDIKALVAFLETNEDEVCVKDVLYMILGLLTQKAFVSSFVEHLNALGGITILLNLIRRHQEVIRLLAFRLIGVLLVAMIDKKVVGTSFLGTSKATAELQRIEKIRVNHVFSVMSEAVPMFPFSDAVRATIFDILLGEACPKQVIQECSNSEQGNPVAAKSLSRAKLTSQISNFFRVPEKLGERVGAFVLPQMLKILFKVLSNSEESMLRLEILKDTLGLLEANPLNSEALTLEPCWQGWLLAALAASLKRSTKTLGDVADESVWLLGPEEALMRKLFRCFHVYCICTSRNGWLHVERTCNFVHLLSKEGQLSEFHTLHVLLGDLVEAIVEGLPLQASLFTQPCRDNALYLLSLVDELILGEAFDLLPSSAPGSTNAEDTGLLSADHLDLGLSPFKISSSRPSEDEWEGTRPEVVRKGSIGVSRWRFRTCSGEHVDVLNKYHCWRLYDKVWSLLITMNGRGAGSGNIYQTGVAGPTLGQRARGLVESLNIPAAEMAAAVVSSGLGAVGMNPPNKLVDKVFRLRGERCPRIVFRLVVLYLYNADLQSATLCVQHFLALLPSFVSSEVEQNRNRLQLFLWTLLDARVKIGDLDDGARIHIVSRLIQETIDIGKSILATSLVEKGKKLESTISESSVQSLLQRDRVVAAVIEEAKHLKSTATQRAQDVEGLLSELDDVNVAESQQKTALEDQSHVGLSSICSIDRSRQTVAQLAYDEEQQAISEQWCHLFRYLTDERGPWSTVPFPNDVILHWKLDKMEDPVRRRLRLRRNYHFNKEFLYPVTSISKGPPVDLVNERENSVELLMGGVRHFLLKGMRGVTEESLSDGDDNHVKSKHSEGIKAEVDADCSGNAEETCSASDASDEGVQEQAHVTLPEEAGEEEVVQSVSCIMVSAKRKVAGRLEIMQSSLHFYGEFIVEGTGGRSVFTSSSGLNYPDAVSMEKGFSKPKMSGRKDFFDGTEGDRGNAMERVDPMQGGLWKGIKRHSRWDLSQVKAVQATRYLLQDSAIEIFFTSSIPPVFFNFPTQRLSKEIGVMIVDLHNGRGSGKSGSRGKEHIIDYIDRRKAIELAEDAKKQWRRREMSNFDYLVTLNTLAGRSYNDATQYPVFPWILSDYTSEKLDLSNSSSFRDLSKPVGALNKKRFEVFEERFQNFSDPDIPSFYYGSHYSSMGILLFYLLRLEPFTLLHRQLQGGKLDHADRLFHSVESAYKNCLTNSSDVKELVPEFFYLPEFLVNSNDYYLGVKQDGETMGDVILPPWAKNAPEVFIQLNREALESEYVSDHIHEWIDLIFGYKQRGSPAIEAANVFYHLTYEGAVDLAAMEDCLERAAIEDQIANFGQTPIQLFRKKHTKRGPAQPIARPLYYAPASITLTSTIPAQSPSPGQKVTKVIYVGLIDGLVVTINKSLSVVVRTWITPALQNFTFSSSQDSYFGIGLEVVLSRKIYGPIVEDVSLDSCCFGTLLVRSSSFLLTCGHWDNSFKVISLDGGDMVQSNSQHKDVVTSLSVAVDGSVVVTGSRDTTVMVWDIEHTSVSTRRLGSIKDSLSEKHRKYDTVVISDKPRHVLCGHDDAITSVAVRVELDIVVSGSKDATCIFHTLRTGRYVRSIRHPNRCAVTNLKVSQHGLVVVYSHGDLSLHVCSINGKWLASVDVKGRLNCMDISHCGHFLVCGGDQGQVLVFKLQSLEVVRRYEGAGVAVTSLTVTPEDCFLVGTYDGALLVFSLEFQYPKKAGFFASIQRHVR